MLPPSWTSRNLAQHHAKRFQQNPGCFEDLLGLIGRSMTVEEFGDRSVRTVSESWFEYKAQVRDFALCSYVKPRAHYVDNDLVVAITDVARTSFVTCFHEHFDSHRPLHGRHPGRGVSVSQRRLRYLDDLRLKEQGRLGVTED